MKPLSIRQVQQTVAGKALTAIPADAPLVTAVCTNSKQMDKGSLFIALRGDKHNAHEFLPDAAAGGAIAALVEDQALAVAAGGDFDHRGAFRC